MSLFFQVDPGLGDNKKARRLRRELGVGRRDVFGICGLLWAHTVTHCADGVLDNYSAEDLADVCEWENAADLAAALVAAGFLEESKRDCGYIVVSWDEHTGGDLNKRADAREKARIRKAKQRGRPHTDATEDDVPPMSRVTSRENVVTSQPDVTMSRPERNGTERNGEDKHTPQLALAEPEPSRPAPSAESVLSGGWDERAGWMLTAPMREVCIAWHCELWGANPNLFKRDAKPLTKALKSLHGQNYSPSDVLKAMRGMRADPWPERPNRNGWEYLERQFGKWLQDDAGRPAVAVKLETVMF